MQGPDNTLLGASVTASDTAGIWANEALVRSSTSLEANFCLSVSGGSCTQPDGNTAGNDANRIGSDAAQSVNNVGGGLGNWSDMGGCCAVDGSYAGVPCGSYTFRTCSEAQAGWTPAYGTGNHGTFGSDSCYPMTNTRTDSSCTGANWAAANGIDYDYAIYMR